MINFFEKHDECPVCTQDIDNEFKTQMISTKQKEKKEIVMVL